MGFRYTSLYSFRQLADLAAKEGFATLVEGSNADDLSDYRPGRRAVAETSTASPKNMLMCESAVRPMNIPMAIP